MTRELFVIFFILLVVRSEFDEASDEEATDADNKANASAKYDIHNIHDRKSYQALLQIMRQQHSRAVKAMFSVTDNKRLKNLMTGVISKMKDVLQDSKNVIDAAEFRPNSEAFPTKDPLRESVAKILENTALYFELTVFLPDFMDHLTHKIDGMKPLLKWCFEFVQKMDIYDTATSNLVLNGAQELLIVPRPKGYKNPHRKIYMQNMKQHEAYEAYRKMLEERESTKKPASLKPKKNSPRLTRAEL